MGKVTGLWAAALIAISMIATACDDVATTVSDGEPESGGTTAPEPQGNPVPNGEPGVPTEDAGSDDAGASDAGEPDSDAGVVEPDAGAFDAGVVEPDAGEPDAGVIVEPDAGTGEVDAGIPDAGPWPLDPSKDYSAAYGLGTPQSAAFDEGLNLWLLDGNRIGVLRPGDVSPTWTTGVGQARDGFGLDKFALGSTVICGGEAGRAYVGYRAKQLSKTIPGKPHSYVPSPGEPYYTPERYAEYQKGDLDAVRLQPDGTVALEEHIWRTVGASNAGKMLGIHNTNDFHYEEDRTILNCQRIVRGPHKGDLYVTSNHSVTHVKGLTYNSHRHPGWYKMVPRSDGGEPDPQLQTTDMYGLGVAQNGDILVANEQMLGGLVPSGRIEDWDREQTWDGPVPWRFKFFNDAMNDQETHDAWRAIEQVVSGKYYVGSAQYGLWMMTLKSRSDGAWTRVTGLPTNKILSLKATDDGALYIGTEDAGLWRLEADGATLARVSSVTSSKILQLVYEPTTTPTMLLVVTANGLSVLRGP